MAKTKSKSATYNPKNTWKYDLKKNGALYLIFLIPFTFLLIFKYIPMVGILMAFQDYKVAKGLFGSPWVGLDKFKDCLRERSLAMLFAIRSIWHF